MILLALVLALLLALSVFAGCKKEDVENMLTDAGAEIAKSVTANTNYVVAEDNLETAKVKIARRKNIPILSLAKIKEMLGEEK